MSAITVLAALGIIVFVVGQQVRGTGITGRRLIVLPLILTIIGLIDVTGQKAHGTVSDYELIGLSAAIALATGVGLGVMTRIERRSGHLWAQLPVAGIAIWAAFIISRIAVMVLAHAEAAELAASTDTILLTLGINRLAQAGVITARAVAAGIPFQPEQDGRVFAADLFARGG